jgi:hypothetical protein
MINVGPQSWTRVLQTNFEKKVQGKIKGDAEYDA